MRLTRCRVFDVRLVGAILSLVVVVPKLSDPETMRRIAPSRVAQGEPGAHIMSFVLSPTGREMATINSEGHVKLRAFDSRDLIDRSLDFRGYAQAVAFSPDGGVLAAVGETSAISLWDLRSRMNQPAAALSVPIRLAKRMTYSPDGRTLAIAETGDGTVLFWDLQRQQASIILHHPSPVVSLAFSPDGRWFATGGTVDGSIRLWDLHDGSWRTVQNDDDELGPPMALAFAPDGTLLAAARASDHCVRSWHIPTGRECRVYAGHTRAVSSIAFSPDGSLLASAGNDGTVLLWTVATGMRKTSLDSRAMVPRTVTFSPDGRTLALATDDDDDIRLWDLADLFVDRQAPGLSASAND
jgi:WD40 repeat protein